MIAFMIAVIVSYIGAQQLRKFGGEFFVVDLVTVSLMRELGRLTTVAVVQSIFLVIFANAMIAIAFWQLDI